MSKVPPTIEFDETRAMRYSPIRNLEFVQIFEKPTDEETVITTKFAGPKTFVGSYVEMVDPETDDVLYGYSYERFTETHAQQESIESDTTYAYQVNPVDAYRADAEGELLTEPGDTVHVDVGDWIFRSLNGEIECMNTEYFSALYDLDSARPIPQGRRRGSRKDRPSGAG